MKNYSQLSKEDKLNVIQKLYIKENKSFQDIAEEYNTYSNKILRDAKAFGIKIRNKSDAQKNALTTGKHKHPTKGQKRSDETKEKIGISVMKSWDNLSLDEIQQRKKTAKENWDKLSTDEKQNMQRSATEAVRLASKKGSKLEIFLLNCLLEDGYSVQFHKEQTLVNTKLQIDLFLSELNIAIEVDGPSHFEPVWGSQSLQRNKKYDQKKEGLILGKGWHLIRVKQKKDFSKSRSLMCYDKLKKQIAILADSVSPQTITIEDENV